MVLPYFEPWIGRGNEVSLCQLLILGESHYGPASMPGNSTCELTQSFASSAWNYRFWTNIMQVVAGRRDDEIDRAAFWSGGVALYNYVQEPVAETAGASQAPAMFLRSKAAFFSVLDRLNPAAILVLSKRLWDNHPQESRSGNDLQKARLSRTRL